MKQRVAHWAWGKAVIITWLVRIPFIMISIGLEADGYYTTAFMLWLILTMMDIACIAAFIGWIGAVIVRCRIRKQVEQISAQEA